MSGKKRNQSYGDSVGFRERVRWGVTGQKDLGGSEGGCLGVIFVCLSVPGNAIRIITDTKYLSKTPEWYPEPKG